MNEKLLSLMSAFHKIQLLCTSMKLNKHERTGKQWSTCRAHNIGCSLSQQNKQLCNQMILYVSKLLLKLGMMLKLLKYRSPNSLKSCKRKTCNCKTLCSWRPRDNDGPFLRHNYCTKNNDGTYQALSWNTIGKYVHHQISFFLLKKLLELCFHHSFRYCYDHPHFCTFLNSLLAIEKGQVVQHLLQDTYNLRGPVLLDTICVFQLQDW